MIEQNEAKRSAGRSPKAITSAPMKKGKSSWAPAALNIFHNKEDGYRYRMSRKDAENLAKKEQEQWETVDNGTTSHEDPDRIEHGKPLTSVNEGRDWLLQRLPEEIAQERDDYHAEKNSRQISGLSAHIKGEMRKGGINSPVHGEITISSRKGTQIIE